MGYELGSFSTKNLHTILKSGKPESKLLVKMVEMYIKHSPVDFGIIRNGGFRTAEEQNKIFTDSNGNDTKCDGYLHKSKHQSGLAVDLVPYVDGKFVWDVKHCSHVAGGFRTFCSMYGVEIVTGADWNGDGNLVDGWDLPHIEIVEF
jgi:hypothetical protein